MQARHKNTKLQRNCLTDIPKNPEFPNLILVGVFEKFTMQCPFMGPI